MTSRPLSRPAKLRATLVLGLTLGWLASTPASADVTPGQTYITTLADIHPPSGNVPVAPYIAATGWDIKEVVVTYNWKTDTLDVDMKTAAIAGDADGLNLMGKNDPQLAAYGGINPASLGGRKSIDVAFSAANADGSMGGPLAIAGVPEYKGGQYAASAGLDGFRLAQYNGHASLGTSYGAPISQAMGTLLYDPSAAHPDFEFTIAGFSHLPGVNFAHGFYLSAYAGSPDDIVAGEDTVAWTHVAGLSTGPQTGGTPPPAGGGGTTPPGIPGGGPPPGGGGGPPILGPPGAVPEPGSVALLGLGGLGLWLARRRKG